MLIRIEQISRIDKSWKECLFVAKTFFGKIVGYCKLKEHPKIKGVGLTDVFIIPTYRRKGIGYELKIHTIRYAFEVLNMKILACAVERNNKASKRNCLKLGYREIKRFSTKKAIRFHLHRKEFYNGKR